MSVMAERPEATIEPMMLYMGRLAREAAGVLAIASTETKNTALRAMAARLEAKSNAILDANRQDIEAAHKNGRNGAFVDRLTLSKERLAAMAQGLRDIAELPDPVGQVMATWTRPNGLVISRVHVPIGVIGIIYESRPNVATDAGGLCVKSGNAVILRCGSETFLSSIVITNALGRRPDRSGLAGRRHPAGADRGSLGGGLHAARSRRRHRCHRAARRQEFGRARATRGPRAGVRASRRRVSRLCAFRRRSRHGQADRAQRQDAAPRNLRRNRNVAGGSRDAPPRI